jgi:hypothetical protein
MGIVKIREIIKRLDGIWIKIESGSIKGFPPRKLSLAEQELAQELINLGVDPDSAMEHAQEYGNLKPHVRKLADLNRYLFSGNGRNVQEKSPIKRLERRNATIIGRQKKKSQIGYDVVIIYYIEDNYAGIREISEFELDEATEYLKFRSLGEAAKLPINILGHIEATINEVDYSFYRRSGLKKRDIRRVLFPGRY